MCLGGVAPVQCTVEGLYHEKLNEKGLQLTIKGTFLQLELTQQALAAESARVRAKSDSSVRFSDVERVYTHSRAHSDGQYWERAVKLATASWADAMALEEVQPIRSSVKERSANKIGGRGAQLQPTPIQPAAPANSGGRKAAGKGKRQPMKQAAPVQPMQRTTLMLKNLPSGYLRPELTKLLEEQGFAGRFNFVHVPVDCFSGSGLGYGFINMVDGLAAEQVYTQLQGFSNWKAKSQKVLELHWGEEQGLDLLVERYRNSRMMHASVPDAYRPVILVNGEVAQFPAPTKRILKPRCMPRSE